MQTSPAIPVLPPSAGARVLVGGPAVLDASLDIATNAKQSLEVDTFRPTRAANLDAIAAANDRGVDVHLRLDTDSIAPKRADMDRLGTIAEYGADPFKQHAKGISRDHGEDALVATDVSDVKSEPRMEFGVRFGGAAGAAFAGVQTLARGSSPETVAAAMDGARALGVFANDPHNGRRDVSTALSSLVGSAKDELYVASKLFDSKQLVKELAAAVDRGARTTVVTHDIDAEQTDLLTKAGVTVQLVPYGPAIDRNAALHGTIVAADGVALMTSMPLKKGAIVGGKGRESREFGVGLDGAAAAELVSTVRAKLDAVPTS
jgi:phosphatidylserine/phosphatidylglycerophosphate/cardiolipin synthase-like enzyme